MKHLFKILILLVTVASARGATVANQFTTNLIPANGIVSNLVIFLGPGASAGQSNSITVTNLAGRPAVRYLLGTNPAGLYPFIFDMLPGDGAYGAFWMNPAHDGGPGPKYSEAQITLPHNIALAPGYGTPYTPDMGNGHIQFGAGGSGPGAFWNTNFTQFGVSTNWYNAYGQGLIDSSVSNSFNLGNQGSYSFAFLFDANYATNGVVTLNRLGAFGQANYLGDQVYSIASDFGPLIFQDVGDPSKVTNAANFYQNKLAGRKVGQILGTVVEERRNVMAASNSIVLDLGSAKCLDVWVASTNLLLSTSNTVPQLNLIPSTILNVESHIIYLRALCGTTITGTNGPTGWGTNGASTSWSITNGQMVRLELEATGLGDTNIALVSAQILQDNSFYWDTDALKWLTNATVNVTNGQTKGIVNWYVSQLKAYNLWTNMDWANPNIADVGWGSANISNASRVNLLNTNNIGTWHGAPTFSANGVTGDGSTAYMDTGFNPTSAAGKLKLNWAHLMIFCGTANGGGQGVALGAENTYFYNTGGGFWNTALNGNPFSVAFANTDFRGTVISSRRSSNRSRGVFRGTISNDDPTTSSALPNSAMFLLAQNNGGGTAQTFNASNIRGWSFGGALSDNDALQLTRIQTQLNIALQRNVP